MYETFEKNEIYLQYSAGSVPALQRHARSAWIHCLMSSIVFASYNLTWKVHRKHWDISYRYGNDCPADQKRNPQELEQAITKALRMWLAPLRPLTKRPIVNDFRYHLNADLAEVDMRITFQCKLSSSFAMLSNRKNPDIVLRVGTTDIYHYHERASCMKLVTPSG